MNRTKRTRSGRVEKFVSSAEAGFPAAEIQTAPSVTITPREEHVADTLLARDLELQVAADYYVGYGRGGDVPTSEREESLRAAALAFAAAYHACSGGRA